MPAEWTGDLVGRMHNARVTANDLSEELGVSKGYISMVLNGARVPKDAETKFNEAFQRILERRAQCRN